MNPGCNGFGVLQDLIHRKHREEEVAEKSRGNAGITCRSRAFVPRELAKISNVTSTSPLWNTHTLHHSYWTPDHSILSQPYQ